MRDWIHLRFKANFPVMALVLQCVGKDTNRPRKPLHMDQKTPHARRVSLDVVETFSGSHSFLSNFHEAPFSWDGQVAASAEHHYNAAKTADPAEKARVYEQPTPGRAKRVGQKVKLREGWDDHLKVECMRSIIQAKFAPGTDMAQRLLRTGEALLIEGNVWHDQYWGQCTCERHYHWAGTSTLGRLLMSQRTALRGGSPTLARVGITGHRPQVLTPAENAWVGEVLPLLMNSLRERYGAQVAISGMTPGAETMWAQSAIDQGLRLWGYSPSLNHPASWPARDQQTHAELTSQASRMVVLGESEDDRWLRARNDLIVRDSSVLIAVHKEGKTSGRTAAVIKRARACNARLIRVNVSRREVTSVEPGRELPWVF